VLKLLKTQRTHAVCVFPLHRSLFEIYRQRDCPRAADTKASYRKTDHVTGKTIPIPCGYGMVWYGTGLRKYGIVCY
jgi:hypothetical protein